jgi:hypothetical protein
MGRPPKLRVGNCQILLLFDSTQDPQRAWRWFLKGVRSAAQPSQESAMMPWEHAIDSELLARNPARSTWGHSSLPASKATVRRNSANYESIGEHITPESDRKLLRTTPERVKFDRSDVQPLTESRPNKPAPCRCSRPIKFVKLHILPFTDPSKLRPATCATMPRQRAHLVLGIPRIQAQLRIACKSLRS